MTHTFNGTVRKLREPSKTGRGAFVLLNGDDWFGASIWLSPTQGEKLNEGDRIEIEGNLRNRQDDNDENVWYLNVVPPKGERYLTIRRTALGTGADKDIEDQPEDKDLDD